MADDMPVHSGHACRSCARNKQSTYELVSINSTMVPVWLPAFVAEEMKCRSSDRPFQTSPTI